MTRLGIKQTLNLHKYNISIKEFLGEWRILIAAAISLSGILLGTFWIKGEGELPEKITYILFEKLINNETQDMFISFIFNLLIPTAFFILVFFCGLSAYGNVLSYIIPLIYSTVIGMFTCQLYSEYKLKGLAAFVILILPFATLSLLGIILITVESVKMSQTVMNVLSNRPKRILYSFTMYYKNSLKSYVPIIMSSVLKTVLDKLFVGLISF